MAKYGYRDVAKVCLKDIITRKPEYFFDSLKLSTTEVTADVTELRAGSGNPIRVIWYSNKDVNYNIEDGLISPQSLALLSGNKLKTGSKKVPNFEVLPVDSDNEVTLAETPADGADMFVFISTENGILGTELTEADTASSGEGEYVINGKEISLNAATCPEGSFVAVDYYYDSPTTTKTITISSDKFCKAYYMEGYTLFRDEVTQRDYPALITIPKFVIQPNFTLEGSADGDAAVLAMTAKALPTGINKEMMIMDILEPEVEGS